MNIGIMLQQAQGTLSKIDRLRVISPYYPDVKFEKEDNEYTASTLVRIEKDKKWYVVHCMESRWIEELTMEKSLETYKHMMLRLMKSVYCVQLFYKIKDPLDICDRRGNPLQDIDKLQMSEKERIETIINLRP